MERTYAPADARLHLWLKGHVLAFKFCIQFGFLQVKERYLFGFIENTHTQVKTLSDTVCGQLGELHNHSICHTYTFIHTHTHAPSHKMSHFYQQQNGPPMAASPSIKLL